MAESRIALELLAGKWHGSARVSYTAMPEIGRQRGIF